MQISKRKLKRMLWFPLMIVVVFMIVDGCINSSSSVVKIEDINKQTRTIEEKSPLLKNQKEETDQKTDIKMVYLTFDDGPSRWTGDLLDVLKEHGIQATFFMQGSNLKQASFQPAVKRATDEGNYIGAHSMTHDSTKLYKHRQLVPEMKETIELIYDITGTKPHLIRPPYGSVPGLNDDVILNQVLDAKLKVWDWTIDSKDWHFQNEPKRIMDILEDNTTEDVEVVLLHENEQTLKLLPQMIAFFKEQGYEFGVYRDDSHFSCNFLADDRL